MGKITAANTWTGPSLDLRAECTPLTAGKRAHEVPPPRSLTVIHFTWQTRLAAEEQGKTLALSWPSWLVTGALILACNNPMAMSTAELERRGSLYPQTWRSVCRVPNNNYRCGQFASWHRLSPWWDARHNSTKFDVVIMLEADVYPTPRAMISLGRALAASPHATFFATYTGASFVDMDYFAFRPRNNLSTRRNFWRRTFDLCNETDPFRRQVSPKGLATEHMLALALARDRIRVHRLLDLSAAELDNAGHAAPAGIDALGFWHEQDPRHVTAWRHVPSLLWQPLVALAKRMNLGDLR